jgi:hypothetical protein
MWFKQRAWSCHISWFHFDQDIPPGAGLYPGMLRCFKLPWAIVHMEKEGPAFPVCAFRWNVITDSGGT